MTPDDGLSLNRGYFSNLLSREQTPKTKRHGAPARDAVVRAYARLAASGTLPSFVEVANAVDKRVSRTSVWRHLVDSGLPLRRARPGVPPGTSPASRGLTAAAIEAAVERAKDETRAFVAASQRIKPPLSLAARAKRDYFRARRNTSGIAKVNTHGESPEAPQPA